MCIGPPRPTYQPARLRRVYPHVYGATIPVKQMALLARGLSPCVWGHHVARCNTCIDYGSIPMCMGPPLLHFYADPSYWVYPHVYGATIMLAGAPAAGKGLARCVWGHRPSQQINPF